MGVLGHQNDRSSMIKVSELFNKEKLHQRCLEAAQYMRMANVDEVKDIVVNDLDFYGTIYQNSDIFFYPNHISADIEIATEVTFRGSMSALVPCPAHGRTVIVHFTDEVDQCFVQPSKGEKSIGTVIIGGGVNKLFYDSSDALKSSKFIKDSFIRNIVPSSDDGVFHITQDVFRAYHLIVDKDIDWFTMDMKMSWFWENLLRGVTPCRMCSGNAGIQLTRDGMRVVSSGVVHDIKRNELSNGEKVQVLKACLTVLGKSFGPAVRLQGFTYHGNEVHLKYR